MRLRRWHGAIGCKHREINKPDAPPGLFTSNNGLLQTGNASGICQTAERFSVCSNPFLVVFFAPEGLPVFFIMPLS
jgi:hypothetical protein